MKLILDFDDTLFNNQLFKNHAFLYLEKKGVPTHISENYYKKIRATDTPFSFKDFLSYFFIREKVAGNVNDTYEEIMNECKNFVNKELIELVRKIGKKSCYLVSNGEKEFQQDKIQRSNVLEFFCEVYITPGSKKEIIGDICDKNKDDTVIFIDNKIKFFSDLDMKRYKNLKTILWDEHGWEKLRALDL